MADLGDARSPALAAISRDGPSTTGAMLDHDPAATPTTQKECGPALPRSRYDRVDMQQVAHGASREAIAEHVETDGVRDGGRTTAHVRGSPIETAQTGRCTAPDADQTVYLRRLHVEPALEVGSDVLPDVVLEVDNTTDVRRGKLGLYASRTARGLTIHVDWHTEIPRKLETQLGAPEMIRDPGADVDAQRGCGGAWRHWRASRPRRWCRPRWSAGTRRTCCGWCRIAGSPTHRLPPRAALAMALQRRGAMSTHTTLPRSRGSSRSARRAELRQ